MVKGLAKVEFQKHFHDFLLHSEVFKCAHKIDDQIPYVIRISYHHSFFDLLLSEGHQPVIIRSSKELLNHFSHHFYSYFFLDENLVKFVNF
jgi:hypothetical protein